MCNTIIDQQTADVNLEELFQTLNGRKYFTIAADYSKDADTVLLSYPNGIEEKSWTQRFRRHGPRKYITHTRYQTVYAVLALTRAQAKALSIHFWQRLDRSAVSGERDTSGQPTSFTLRYTAA